MRTSNPVDSFDVYIEARKVWQVKHSYLRTQSPSSQRGRNGEKRGFKDVN
jgi:hypothetical protein